MHPATKDWRLNEPKFRLANNNYLHSKNKKFTWHKKIYWNLMLPRAGLLFRHRVWPVCKFRPQCLLSISVGRLVSHPSRESNHTCGLFKKFLLPHRCAYVGPLHNSYIHTPYMYVRKSADRRAQKKPPPPPLCPYWSTDVLGRFP